MLDDAGREIPDMTQGCQSCLWEMIEGIKSNQSEVKTSKSDKQLQSYGHLKFCLISC